jgi:hypothetical protein
MLAHAEKVAETVETSDWSLEGARLQVALYILFKELRYGWEAVPFQNSSAEFFATFEIVPSEFSHANSRTALACESKRLQSPTNRSRGQFTNQPQRMTVRIVWSAVSLTR